MTLALLWFTALLGCTSKPIPPEVKQVEVQELNLWRADAELYTPKEYRSYKEAIRKGKDLLVEENARFEWFRNYDSVGNEFMAILGEGEQLLQKIQTLKEEKSKSITYQISYSFNKIETLKRLSSLVNEGRISRKPITQAEVLLKETGKLFNKGEFIGAEERLKKVSFYITVANKLISPLLGRYTDRDQIRKWRTWVDETIRESKEKGSQVIIVSKIDRVLTLYKNGIPYKSYPAGFGFNGTDDKLYAGDRATPEGKYRVIKKLPTSRYYKALLLNYPNEDDRRQFVAAKKKGLIPQNVDIGGLIEIHGGGSGGMTYGCIALDNHKMGELYNLVDIGTPVTIVGALEYENSISKAIQDL